MRHATRWKWAVAWMLGGVALVGGAASIGALAGDTERVGNSPSSSGTGGRGSW